MNSQKRLAKIKPGMAFFVQIIVLKIINLTDSVVFSL